ncbi:unnamed protein product, partial [Anisakis simplex]|uniref:DUF4283 domain-containing protein n=1 Tax=Anisakis simplex TaxID=6269 RepID=A0A0M3JQQ3_ANISI
MLSRLPGFPLRVFLPESSLHRLLNCPWSWEFNELALVRGRRRCGAGSVADLVRLKACSVVDTRMEWLDSSESVPPETSDDVAHGRPRRPRLLGIFGARFWAPDLAPLEQLNKPPVGAGESESGSSVPSR